LSIVTNICSDRRVIFGAIEQFIVGEILPFVVEPFLEELETFGGWIELVAILAK
jgi:hypothetical protein